MKSIPDGRINYVDGVEYLKLDILMAETFTPITNTDDVENEKDGIPLAVGTTVYSATDNDTYVLIDNESGSYKWAAKSDGDVFANAWFITWKNGDDILGTDLVENGETPSYSGETPTKESTEEYDYTFSGWSPALASASADATYTATFTSTKREYTITWLDWDGTTLDSDQVKYGETPSYTGETPTREGYTFSDWTPEIVAVVGNASYTAEYTENGEE